VYPSVYHMHMHMHMLWSWRHGCQSQVFGLDQLSLIRDEHRSAHTRADISRASGQ